VPTLAAFEVITEDILENLVTLAVGPQKLIVFVDIDDTLVRSIGSKRIPMPRVVERVKSAVSMFLSEQRNLTLEQVRQLSARFKLPADVFIRQAVGTTV
jgi:hypothetical protein